MHLTENGLTYNISHFILHETFKLLKGQVIFSFTVKADQPHPI